MHLIKQHEDELYRLVEEYFHATDRVEIYMLEEKIKDEINFGLQRRICVYLDGRNE